MVRATFAAVLRVLSRAGGASNKKINEEDAEDKDNGSKDYGDVENEQPEQGSRVAGRSAQAQHKSSSWYTRDCYAPGSENKQGQSFPKMLPES